MLSSQCFFIGYKMDFMINFNRFNSKFLDLIFLDSSLVISRWIYINFLHSIKKFNLHWWERIFIDPSSCFYYLAFSDFFILQMRFLHFDSFVIFWSLDGFLFFANFISKKALMISWEQNLIGSEFVTSIFLLLKFNFPYI